MTQRSVLFWSSLAIGIALSRLAHLNVLWADEDYHLAAAIQLLHGKLLYRDVWYDKPPGSALMALLWGGYPGWLLRLAGSALAVAICAAGYRFASQLWSPREGYVAALLLACSQVFYFAQGALPLEPDTWMILPHLLAVYWAWRGRALASGVAAGVAFLFTPKGGFVLLSALVFRPSGWMPMLAGFAIPNALAMGWLAAGGALRDYWEQVWEWGFAYAGSSPDQSAIAPVLRLGTWAGFHAAVVIGAMKLKTGPRKQIALWVAIAFAAAMIGWRLPPRYLNQLLAPLAIAAAGGWAILLRQRVWAALFAILLAVPAIRFGPRYTELAADNLAGRAHTWTDVHLDQESRQAAAIINGVAQPGDTIFVWGYRPNIVAYTRLPVASRLWESQPLTGVPADRHLREADSIDPVGAQARRAELAHAGPDGLPDIVVDGLSRYNPRLDIAGYPELKPWIEQYCPAGSAGGIVVYRRCR